VAAALAGALPEGWTVCTLTQGVHPGIESLLARMAADGIDELVVVPLQPHFSARGTGAFMPALYRALRRRGRHLSVTVRAAWYDDAGYVNALARLIAEHASAHGLRPSETDLRFCVPGAAPADADDPWPRQLQRTVELTAQRSGWPAERVFLEFRDRSSHRNLRGRVASAADRDANDTRSLEVPLGFACAADRRDAAAVCPPLRTCPSFIAALRHIVLHGARPLPPASEGGVPLLAPRPGEEAGAEPAAFVMIGVSLAGSLARSRGPALRHSDPAAFGRVKKSHKALQAFLGWVRERTPVYEALVWNTCQRTEFYGWLPEVGGMAERDRLVRRIRAELFGSEPDGLEVNVLLGDAARHHLLRTACGLNSDLPGDRDVAAQLETACRLAQSAGTAGARAVALVGQAVSLAGEVTARTALGEFSTGYCAAALARVFEVDGLRPGDSRHVVIGGSTTSRAVLAALIEQHHVPHRQITAVYRDHHGQMKEMRTALGSARRLRVHSYLDQRVLGAIAEADFVFFGIDQTEPVIAASALLDSRDLATRPLTLVDFNSFGSIDEDADLAGARLWTARQLDQAVATHVAITTTRAGFTLAQEQAEEWIARRTVDPGAPAPALRPPGSRTAGV
jgi:glutamyl-tRNA reductase